MPERVEVACFRCKREAPAPEALAILPLHKKGRAAQQPGRVQGENDTNYACESRKCKHRLIGRRVCTTVARRADGFADGNDEEDRNSVGSPNRAPRHSRRRLSSIVHVTHSAARRHSRRFLLRTLRHHRLGGHEQPGDRGRILPAPFGRSWSDRSVSSRGPGRTADPARHSFNPNPQIHQSSCAQTAP